MANDVSIFEDRAGYGVINVRGHSGDWSYTYPSFLSAIHAAEKFGIVDDQAMQMLRLAVHRGPRGWTGPRDADLEDATLQDAGFDFTPA